MTAKNRRNRSPKNDFTSLSNAMCDFMYACMSFPTPGDVTWKLSHPQHRDPKNKKKSA